MQNRYVGDVGDFGKYALLRRLLGAPAERQVRLGIIWCLFPDESHNNDGRHVSYLSRCEFSDLDPELHKALNEIVKSGHRRISSVAQGGIFPAETVFCDAPVSPPKFRTCAPTTRMRHRSAWLEECLKLTGSCNLVFFDPDNGFEVKSVNKQHANAGKYIFWDELAPFWRLGKSLLIYHHLNRTVSAARQIETLALRFVAEFERAKIIPLVFRRGSSRVFWLVHHRDPLGQELEKRVADLLNGGWSRHFRPLGWPDDDQASTRAR
jgi:hypothetical protein